MAAALFQLAIVAALCLAGANAGFNPVQIQLDMLDVRVPCARRRLSLCHATPARPLHFLHHPRHDPSLCLLCKGTGVQHGDAVHCSKTSMALHRTLRPRCCAYPSQQRRMRR